MNKIALIILVLSIGMCLSHESFAQHGSVQCCVVDLHGATNQFQIVNTMAQAMEDPSFKSLHPAPLPITIVEKGDWVTFNTSDGKTARAYSIGPTTAHTVIFMMHEWWGLNPYIQSEAEKLQSKLGNVRVLALDFFDGKIATTPDTAMKLVTSTPPERLTAIIQGALSYVGPKVEIGTIGWCYGGGLSLQAALAAGKQCDACVMYYGMPVTDTNRLKELRAPVLGIFGTKDKSITPDKVVAFEAAMKEAHKKLTVHNYDAVHGFANPSNPNHDETATQEAYKYTLAFFKEHLKR